VPFLMESVLWVLMNHNLGSAPQKSDGPKSNQWIRYSGMGLQMLVIIGLGVWGGYKLDKIYHTESIFTIVLSLVSVILSMALVIREFTKRKK
jgi:ATP synthase protein I